MSDEELAAFVHEHEMRGTAQPIVAPPEPEYDWFTVDRLLRHIWELRSALVDEGWEIHVALRNHAQSRGWK